MSFPDPNANSFDPVPRQKQGSPVVKIIIILAIVLLVIGLACAGLCAWGMYAGMNIAGEQFAAQFRDNPVVVEHIGVIEHCKMDLTAAFEVIQEKQAAGEVAPPGLVVFSIRGDKGEGQLILLNSSSPQMGSPFTEGVLRMSTGEEYDLMPELDEVELEVAEPVEVEVVEGAAEEL